jgi:DNA-binding CsgD family transcriptional regulator
VPAGLADDRQALLATERISGYLHDLEPARWRHQPAPLIEGTGPGARMLAVALAWESVIDGTDRRLALELVRFGIADDILLRADTGLLWVIAGQVLDLCDEDSAAVWSAGLAQAHARGDMFTMLGMQLWRGWVQWGRGDLREAHQMLTAGTEMSDFWAAGGTASGYGEAFLLGVLIDQGDLGVARAYLDHIRPHYRMAESARMFGEAQARLLMAEGDAAAALSSLDGVSHLMETVRNPAWRPWRTLRAEVLAHLGRPAEARELVDEELDLARQWGTPRVIGRTLRVRGVLRGAGGAADLREVIELLSGGTARVELARALIALARVSDRDEAVTLLLRAVSRADEAGASGERRAAMSALAALGAATPPPRSAATTLSATERQILDLHLDGVDERRIADALLLTPRSVRAALDAIRLRLDGRSPAELRAALLD